MTRWGLVVPVYNERDRIDEYLPRIVAWATQQQATLLIVDDGSADGTAERVEAMLSGTAGALLRRHHAGKGGAVAAGVRAVSADTVAFCDLDLSTPLADVERLLRVAERAAVLVIGSRDVVGSTLACPEGKARETLGRAYNRLLQLLVTPGVVDTQCGAKAASSDIWHQITSRCREQGFAWDAEVVAAAIDLGIDVREVPVTWTHDARTRVRVLRDGVDMVAAAFRIARRHSPSPSGPPATTPARGTDGPLTGHARELVEAGRRHWWFRSRAALVATALRRFHAPVDLPLVDVGAGPGWLTGQLGWDPERTFAVESDRRLTSVAASAGANAVHAAGEALPLASGTCGVVTLLDVLEHAASPELLLGEAHRVLADSGLAVVLVPAHPWLWSTTDEHLGHLRRYPADDLRRELRAAGFDVVLVAGVFAWAVPALVAVRKLLGRVDTGLRPTSVVVDRMALVLTSIERHLLGRLRQPLGASWLAVGRRAAGRPDGHR